MDIKSEKKAIAFHEAGHCVVFDCLGYGVKSCWIDEQKRCGQTVPERYVKHARHAITILLAGTFATLKHDPTETEPHLLGQGKNAGDWYLLGIIGSRFIRQGGTVDGFKILLGECTAEANRLLNENWAEVTATAGELMEKGCIGDREGPATAWEWDTLDFGTA